MPDEPLKPDRLAWWQREVFYQIYPRSFQDSNGDGNGDLRGIANGLDYIEWLGASALWVCPFFRSPMADGGYDISDFVDVDPVFGTMGDFNALLETSHARGLKLVIDLVPNHTSDEHPWFRESRSSRGNAKRDWYVWGDGADDGPPTNWLSRGVGGFRVDAVTNLVEDQLLRAIRPTRITGAACRRIRASGACSRRIDPKRIRLSAKCAEFDGNGQWKAAISTMRDRRGESFSGGATLRPHEGLIAQRLA